MSTRGFVRGLVATLNPSPAPRATRPARAFRVAGEASTGGTRDTFPGPGATGYARAAEVSREAADLAEVSRSEAADLLEHSRSNLEDSKRLRARARADLDAARSILRTADRSTALARRRADEAHREKDRWVRKARLYEHERDEALAEVAELQRRILGKD